jgi:hypothetical protein
MLRRSPRKCHQERTQEDVLVLKRARTTVPGRLLRHGADLAETILARRHTPNTADEHAPSGPAPLNDPAAIVISYSRVDQQLAQALCEALKAHGHQVSIDHHELGIGDPLIERNDRFEQINTRLRRLAVTAGMYVTLLAWSAAVVTYIVALATGHSSPPPPPPPLPWLAP